MIEPPAASALVPQRLPYCLARGSEIGRLEDPFRQRLTQPPGECDRTIALELAILIDLTEAAECSPRPRSHGWR